LARQDDAVQTSITVVPYSQADHTAVRELLRARQRLHLHLDWRSLDGWLAAPNLICLVAQNAPGTGGAQRVVACLGAAGSAGGVAWLRMGALAGWATLDALDALWGQLRAELVGHGVAQVGVLAIDGWIEGSLPAWGFVQSNAVVTYRHRGKHQPAALVPALNLRHATREDLPAIARIDEVAFGPLWRHNQTDLGSAFGVAASVTVAELEGHIVGYELSTQHRENGHLARLAVLPHLQGQGIGSCLVSSVLVQFHQRGIREVTVNTQQDNHVSQHLYERMGFKPTRHSIPVWTLDLNAN
jgi:ribosomal-protein-alanine N-acetyltransferase